MTLSKKLLLRLFFGIEIVVFVSTYVGSSGGLSTVYAMKKENENLKNQLVDLEQDVKKIENEYKKWAYDPFYKEKWAREQLQMARADDEVYFLV